MKTTRFNLTTAVALVVPKEPFQRDVSLHTASGSTYLGGADVTSNNGLHLPNGNTITLTIPANEMLHATSNASSTFIVLDSGTVD